jgi:hypothetical protein
MVMNMTYHHRHMQGGASENSALLNNAVGVAEQLAAMLDHYGFDGWLVNIEAPLPGGLADHTRLCGFLGKLREACRARCAMCVAFLAHQLAQRARTPERSVPFSSALAPLQRIGTARVLRFQPY